MNLIKNKANYELTVKNSCFICNIGYADTKAVALEFIEKIKKRYIDASHNCYAYILLDNMASSDNGEPTHTAGLPIINVLKKQNIVNVVCVVTRYYGGIKLGIGGLVRAYTKCTVECLKNIEIVPYIENIKISFMANYNKINEIENLLSKYNQNKKIFNANIELEYTIPKIQLNQITKSLHNLNIQKIDLIK
ncbi:MAG: YigZ family protein [Clostridia bacterium]|jgi:uncharacterized YigZ family protein|nr:YigZ family protein [Clostridia bacterium]MDD4275538.1 YigZ family protein [Clostridia bacterium]